MINDKEKTFISAVLYIHDNEKSVKNFLQVVDETLSETFEKYEIICVNDCCTDNSVQAIKDFASQKSGETMISIINMSIYQGLELSMNAGVDLAIGDYVYEFDNMSMDYDSKLITDIYRKSQEGYDIVAVAPERMKHKSSRLFYHIYNKHSGSIYKLRTESFRILSRRAINRVNSISKTIPYRKALYGNSGLKMDILTYPSRVEIGRPLSKQVNESRRELAFDTLILFTNLAHKIALTLSMLLLLFTAFSAVYTCVVFFGQHRPVAGWTTTMLLLSVGFSGVFLLLAIVIKYLSVLVDLVFKRQKYLIESIEKITK